MRIHTSIVAVALLACLSFSLSAQDRGGYERYLNGLDKNRNGRIDPDEMSSRSRDWIRGLGLDTKRSVRISDIVSRQERKSSSDRKRRERDKADKNFSNNVPGFSSDPPESDEKIQGFGFQNSNLMENGKSITVGKKQYSSSVIRQTDDTMRRYDRDKDGVLDRRELERGRWSNPPWKDSDKNKDSRLTRAELLERYKLRESNWKGSSSTTGSSSSRSRYSKDRKSSWRNSSVSSNSLSSRRSSTSYTKSGSSSSKSSGDNSSYYPKYVRGIIDKYDKNKDGKLSSKELAKMSRAPKNADTDKDGKLSYDEMLAYYTKGSSSKSSSSKGSSRSGGSRFGSRGGSSRSTVSFSRNDKNQDGQIAMHEYTDDWNDEILAEFNKVDENGDGFISKHEFEASKNKSGSSSSRSSSNRSSSSSRRSRFGRDR